MCSIAIRILKPFEFDRVAFFEARDFGFGFGHESGGLKSLAAP
jgi:hypothetical protein